MQYLSFLASIFKSIFDLGKKMLQSNNYKILRGNKINVGPSLRMQTTHTLSKIWSNSAYSGDSAPGIEQD